MKRTIYTARSCASPPSWFRWLSIAGATLVLCSCRTLTPQPNGSGDDLGPDALPPSVEAAAAPSGPSPSSVGRSLTDGAATDDVPRPATAASQVVPVSYAEPSDPPYIPPQSHGPPQSSPAPVGLPRSTEPVPYPWHPPGFRPPFPHDEYLFDGGDRDVPVNVGRNWRVDGLDSEDTVVHYDTVDGKVQVEASNRVPIYAPRFAAVRKLSGIVLHEHHQRLAGVDRPIRINRQDDISVVSSMNQPVGVERHQGMRTANSFRDLAHSGGLENSDSLASARIDTLPYEDTAFVRKSKLENSEKARLSQKTVSVSGWSHDKAVQVVLDNITAHQEIGSRHTGQTHSYVLPDGKSRLRVIKTASRKDAHPGDVIDFTLRFDNVGDQTIGNVTVIDNLTTRLEYLEGSQSCDRQAEFLHDVNDAESLVLRWEIDEPLKVGEGGVIRFQCRVR